ncbi:hypothetical protein [Kangiella sp. TOML190]|uniref:hypothetical protein n=1 Tax=Kangiella sp. TOML190 TaxID=2931351 RepID=UPI00203B4171|nr:hypothetical protein [Kangiella sp. TOML190]
MGQTMRLGLLLIGIIIISGCSSSSVQSAAKTVRGLTGGDVPRSQFLDPSVKQALEHEMRVCLDGNYEDVELRSKCVQVAYAKVKAQKGLDELPEVDGEVIVKQVDEDDVIDGTEDKKDEDGDQ